MKKIILQNKYTWESANDIAEDICFEIQGISDMEGEFKGSVEVIVIYNDPENE